MKGASRGQDDRWVGEYHEVLRQYLRDSSESTLRTVGALGARLASEDVHPTALIDVHQERVEQLCWENKQDCHRILRDSGIVGAELFRGFCESREVRRLDAQQQLRESEQRYRALAEGALVSIFITGLDDRIQYVNTYGARLLGKSPEEIVGMLRSDIFRGAVGEEQRKQLNAVIQTGEPREEVARTVFPNGATVWLATALTPIKNDDGAVVSVMGVSRDVTDLKCAEEESRIAHGKLEATLSALPDLLFEIDAEGRILDYRAPRPEQLYASPETYLGKTVAEIHPEPAAGIIMASIRQALETGKSEGATYALGTPDRTRWFELSIARSGDPETSKVRLVVLARDITERKQAGEELRHSAKRLRGLIDGIGPHILVGVMTPDGVLIEANEPGLRIANLKPEDVLGKPCEEGYWFNYSQEVQLKLRNSIRRAAQGESSRYDMVIRVGEDRFATIDFSIRPLRNEMGEIVYLIPSATDITDRKQAEKALQESGQRHRLFLENFDGIAYQIPIMASRPYFINGTVEAITGYTAEDFISGRVTWNELIHADDQNTVRKMEEALRDRPGFVADREYRILRRDGQTRWVRDIGRVVCMEDGRTRVIQGAIHDIDKRKQAENALHLSEERFSALFAGITDAVFVHHITPDGYPGDIIDVNDVACRMLDYSREELIGMGIGEIDATESNVDTLRIVEELQTGRDVFFEQTHLGKDGTLIPVEVHAQTFNYEGQLAILSTVRDITERKRDEEALRQAHNELEIRVAERTQELQAANQKLSDEIAERSRAELDARRWRSELAHMSRLATMGEMATGLAHEINQPLAAIKHFAQGCLRRLRQNPDQVQPDLLEIIAKVVEQAERAATIVERQRAFTKKGRPHFATVDLNDVVERAVEFISHEIKEQSVDLDLTLAQSAPKISADIVQLMQVLLNILRNSLDAMHENDQERRRIDVETAYAGGEAVVCTVRDTGRACGDEIIEHIFDAFFTTKENGLGMGLAISRSIIEAHGGRLWAAANPEGGMTFQFTAPTAMEKDLA